MAYDQHCFKCPYLNQRHLSAKYQTKRPSPPVELEANGSSTLLVFQAPGDIEWAVGKPIQPTTKRGGSAGARIAQSWARAGKQRTDFDIINAVQCFPGNDGDRDLEPGVTQTKCCARRLMEVLLANSYRKIIVFGDVARSTVKKLLLETKQSPELPEIKHPNGGGTNKERDAI